MVGVLSLGSRLALSTPKLQPTLHIPFRAQLRIPRDLSLRSLGYIYIPSLLSLINVKVIDGQPNYLYSRHNGQTTLISLKELKLSAPLELISEPFPIFPGPPLVDAVLNSAAWPGNHYYNNYQLSLQVYLPGSVRNVHITLGPGTYHNLRYPQGIENLHIHGNKKFEPSFTYSPSYPRTNPKSSYISSIKFTLKELAPLLQSAPCLKDAALLLGICQPPDSPTYFPHHPLKKLTILKPAPASAGLIIESGPAVTGPEPTPMFLTKVAHFLDFPAPSLEALTAEGGDKTWDSIFWVVKLCQEV